MAGGLVRARFRCRAISQLVGTRAATFRGFVAPQATGWRLVGDDAPGRMTGRALIASSSHTVEVAVTTVGTISAGKAEFPWMRAPLDEAPAILETPDLVVTSETVALFIAGLRVYSTGIEVRLEVRFKGDRPSTEAVAEFQSLMQGDRERGSGRLNFGMRYPDGTLSENMGLNAPVSPAMRIAQGSPPLVTLSGRATVGSFAEVGYWCWPLPSDGDATVFVSWLDQGLELTEWPIGADELGQAKARVRHLWRN